MSAEGAQLGGLRGGHPRYVVELDGSTIGRPGQSHPVTLAVDPCAEQGQRLCAGVPDGHDHPLDDPTLIVPGDLHDALLLCSTWAARSCTLPCVSVSHCQRRGTAATPRPSRHAHGVRSPDDRRRCSARASTDDRRPATRSRRSALAREKPAVPTRGPRRAGRGRPR